MFNHKRELAIPPHPEGWGFLAKVIMKFVELFDNDMKPKWDIIENIPQFAALKTTKQRQYLAFRG